MARSGDRGDLLATGPRSGPLREPSALESSDDATWVAAARDGDRTAFGRLYERYARMVHGVLLAKVPVGDVDDLVQDVFIRALRRLSTLRETASFGAWLAAIARNVAHDYHRRLVPEEPLPDDAARTGMTYGSVRVNLHRGMEQLRAKLSADPSRVRPEQEKS